MESDSSQIWLHSRFSLEAFKHYNNLLLGIGVSKSSPHGSNEKTRLKTNDVEKQFITLLTIM